jgi:iron complex outermembrane receptor protein
MDAIFQQSVVATVLSVSLSSAVAADFIPQLTAHDNPHPFHIAPLYDLVDAGGEMPYVQDMVKPSLGSIKSVLDLDRTARLGSSYNGATGGSETFVDLKFDHSIFSMHATAVTEGASDYETAAGAEQRFGYDRSTQRLILGLTPNTQRKLQLIYTRDSIDDQKMPLARPVLYAGGTLGIAEGFGHDPIETEREALKLSWDEAFEGGMVTALHAELFSLELDRRANNFDLRPTTPVAIYSEAIPNRTTEWVKVGTDLKVGDNSVNLGLKYTEIRHDAQRYGGPGVPGGLSTVSAYQYPGVELNELLLTATSVFPIDKEQEVTFGLNWQHEDATATKAHLNAAVPAVGNPSSMDLYQVYYGAGVEIDQKESHWSTKVQWDYKPKKESWSGYASVGRFYRAPDTKERYFAAQSFDLIGSSAMGPSARAVGNPEIDWELHRRLEGGVTLNSDAWVAYGDKRGSGAAWQFKAKAYHDDIDDFISRDRAHGQTVTGINDSARIWRNVDATMLGVELDLQSNLTKHFAARINLQATRGRNRSDHRDLYGISPMELNWFLDYFGHLQSGGSWNLGGRIRHVAKHDDVDADPTTGSGFDAGETKSFTVLDLYASVQWRDRFAVRFGVNNANNEEYADADAEYQMEGNPYLVDAPGRHYYVALIANF